MLLSLYISLSLNLCSFFSFFPFLSILSSLYFPLFLSFPPYISFPFVFDGLPRLCSELFSCQKPKATMTQLPGRRSIKNLFVRALKCYVTKLAMHNTHKKEEKIKVNQTLLYSSHFLKSKKVNYIKSKLNYFQELSDNYCGSQSS